MADTTRERTRAPRGERDGQDVRSAGKGQEGGKDQAGHAGSDDLRDSPMMAHLLDALEQGADVGHYGRLTFAMVARHFVDEDELVELLSGQPGMDEREARSLLMQVQGRDYNPPRRERILEWQAQQEFPICPDPDDPAACNVYRELRFPDGIYENIAEFHEQEAEQQMDDAA